MVSTRFPTFHSASCVTVGYVCVGTHTDFQTRVLCLSYLSGLRLWWAPKSNNKKKREKEKNTKTEKQREKEIYAHTGGRIPSHLKATTNVTTWEVIAISPFFLPPFFFLLTNQVTVCFGWVQHMKQQQQQLSHNLRATNAQRASLSHPLMTAKIRKKKKRVCVCVKPFRNPQYVV